MSKHRTSKTTSTHSGDGPQGNQFIGCVVSVKLRKPKNPLQEMFCRDNEFATNGDFEHIIGKVSSINVSKQQLSLEKGIKDGREPLPDGFILDSNRIVDLFVIAKTDEEIQELEERGEIQKSAKPVAPSKPIDVPPNRNGVGGSFIPFPSSKSASSPRVVYSASNFEEFIVKATQPLSPELKEVHNEEMGRLSRALDPYSLIMESHMQNSEPRNEIGSGGGGNGSAFKQVQKSSSRNTDRRLVPEKKDVSARNELGNSGDKHFKKIPVNAGHGKRNVLAQEDNPFMMSPSEIQNQGDFDFEENLAQFQKLPVERKPEPNYDMDVHRQTPRNKIEAHKILEKKLLSKNPNEHTTLQQERRIESVKILNGRSDESQYFITDLGVLIPCVKFLTRKSILNSTHSAGLTYDKLVEIMGRATAQIIIPMIGDSYRLSPERPEELRPRVLISINCESHWQANVSLCAGRILATLGVKTFLLYTSSNGISPLSDISRDRLAVEESLYALTGNPIYFSEHELIKDLVKMSRVTNQDLYFDLYINGTNSLDSSPFSQFSISSLNQVLVDFADGSSETLNNGFKSKTFLIASCLPLESHYSIVKSSAEGKKESSCKYYLVNLGIPKKIFEHNDISYVSPFADRLFVQAFLPKGRSK